MSVTMIRPVTDYRVPVLDADSALRVARELAAEFAAGAAKRDRERILPEAELEELSDSGLLAITVPAEYGGADLPAEVVAEVCAIIASGDPNIAQLPHSHFVYVNAIRHTGTPGQQAFFFGEVLAGKRFGNAQSETGTKHVRDIRTTLIDGRLNGVKGYCTGALFAHWIPVLTHLDRPDSPLYVAWVERHAAGVSITDDWNGMGQRTTASGTVTLTDVAVSPDRVTPYHQTFEGPQTYGAFAQLLHAAFDAGIAQAAVAEAAEFVRTCSRPYPDAGVEKAYDDPLVIHAFGQMEVRSRSAMALVREAGRAVDAANANLTEASATEASLAVAAARSLTTDVSVEIGSRVFEVAGTRSALDSLNLNRHWRNARTHTLHDPAAWKVQHLGRYVLNGVLPPNHGQL